MLLQWRLLSVLVGARDVVRSSSRRRPPTRAGCGGLAFSLPGQSRRPLQPSPKPKAPWPRKKGAEPSTRDSPPRRPQKIGGWRGTMTLFQLSRSGLGGRPRSMRNPSKSYPGSLAGPSALLRRQQPWYPAALRSQEKEQASSPRHVRRARS